jgi:hypothetical protein
MKSNNSIKKESCRVYNEGSDRIRGLFRPSDIASAFAAGYGGTSRICNNLKDTELTDFH